MLVLGIDPGQTGGFAAVNKKNQNIIVAFATPLLTVRKKVTLDFAMIYEHLEELVIGVGVIEQVSAMPRQGVSSSFQFGRMYGAAEMVMYDWCLKQEYVTPQKWKKYFGLSSTKQASLDLATRLFGREAARQYWPLKKHEGVAEAALIALWHIRTL